MDWIADYVHHPDMFEDDAYRRALGCENPLLTR